MCGLGKDEGQTQGPIWPSQLAAPQPFVDQNPLLPELKFSKCVRILDSCPDAGPGLPKSPRLHTWVRERTSLARLGARGAPLQALKKLKGCLCSSEKEEKLPLFQIQCTDFRRSLDALTKVLQTSSHRALECWAFALTTCPALRSSPVSHAPGPSRTHLMAGCLLHSSSCPILPSTVQEESDCTDATAI